MAEVTLEVTRREVTGKEIAKKLRRDGKVPAVVYGGHREPVAITVDRKAIAELLQKSEHGIRSVFLLKMADSDQQRHAMIKDLTINPISRKMTHIDFVRVVMDELVRTTVPVHIVGTAIGVKEGGLLDFQVRDLHVECFPNAIPDAIDVAAVWQEEWERHVLDAALQRLKRRLDPRHYQIFDCVALKEWPAAKVARELGVNVARVYLVKHRAAAMLKKEIAAIQESQ